MNEEMKYLIYTPSITRDRIVLAVLKLRENCQLDKLEKKWWVEKGQCGKMTNKKKVCLFSLCHATGDGTAMFIMVMVCFVILM